MTSTREAENPRQPSVDKVVRDGGYCHSHGGGHAFLRHQDTRADHDFLSAFRVVSFVAKNEMNNTPVYLDAIKAGREGVRDRNWFGNQRRVWLELLAHAGCPRLKVGEVSYNSRGTYKTEALSRIAGELKTISSQFFRNVLAFAFTFLRFLHGIHKPSHGAGYSFHPIIAKYQPLIVHRSSLIRTGQALPQGDGLYRDRVRTRAHLETRPRTVSPTSSCLQRQERQLSHAPSTVFGWA